MNEIPNANIPTLKKQGSELSTASQSRSFFLRHDFKQGVFVMLLFGVLPF